jgi:hypothetical protein
MQTEIKWQTSNIHKNERTEKKKLFSYPEYSKAITEWFKLKPANKFYSCPTPTEENIVGLHDHRSERQDGW